MASVNTEIIPNVTITHSLGQRDRELGEGASSVSKEGIRIQ